MSSGVEIYVDRLKNVIQTRNTAKDLIAMLWQWAYCANNYHYLKDFPSVWVDCSNDTCVIISCTDEQTPTYNCCIVLLHLLL